MKRLSVILVTLITLLLPILCLAEEKELSAQEILDRVDEMWRGESSYAVITMTIKTRNWERTLKMKAFSLGKDYTLVTIMEPAKEKGTSTLKVEDNIWNYLPKTRRVVKIPSSMMMSSWMGSHLTNDDLVKESRYTDDYTYKITDEKKVDSEAVYEITLNPKPDAAVVWGKILMIVEKERLVPKEMKYYDENGKLVRTMSFSEVEEVDDHVLPTKFTVTPMDKEGEYTELKYEKIRFGVDIEKSFFSIQNLKRSM